MSKEPVNQSPMRNKARRALRRFENAVRQHAFKGSQPVEDWEDIDYEYARAKREVLSYMDYIP